jgi:Tfp pilus assembly protein FimT
MRLTFVSCILPAVLASSIVPGQQATAAATVKPAQQDAMKSSTAKSTPAKVTQKGKTSHGTVASKHSKMSSQNAAKRPAYRPEYTQNSVEVMNGESTQKIVFNSDQAASGSRKDVSAVKTSPAPLKVEVVNGASTDTQYFYGDNGRQGSDEKRPVVVAVQSSDTRFVGGNKHPVVTGITAVGRVDAKSARGSGQKVMTAVSPQPKRPEYQPDAH